MNRKLYRVNVGEGCFLVEAARSSDEARLLAYAHLLYIWQETGMMLSVKSVEELQ